MLRLVCVLLLCVFATSCAKHTTSKDVRKDIPKHANAIKIFADGDDRSLYLAVREHLTGLGFVIMEEDKAEGAFQTGFTEIKNDTELQIRVDVDKLEQGAMAYMQGRWKMTEAYAGTMGDPSPKPEEAIFLNTGRRTIAFGHMAEIANDIPHTRIEYVTKK